MSMCVSPPPTSEGRGHYIKCPPRNWPKIALHHRASEMQNLPGSLSEPGPNAVKASYPNTSMLTDLHIPLKDKPIPRLKFCTL